MASARRSKTSKLEAEHMSMDAMISEEAATDAGRATPSRRRGRPVANGLGRAKKTVVAKGKRAAAKVRRAAKVAAKKADAATSQLKKSSKKLVRKSAVSSKRSQLKATSTAKAVARKTKAKAKRASLKSEAAAKRTASKTKTQAKRASLKSDAVVKKGGAAAKKQATKAKAGAKKASVRSEAVAKKTARRTKTNVKRASLKGEAGAKRVTRKAKTKAASAGVGRKPSARAKKAARKLAEPAVGNRGIAEGSQVPSFSVPDQSGHVLRSTELQGQPFVLYFYPKNDTPGCTREACGFRDRSADYAAAGIRVIGVSPDSIVSHSKFAQKHGLNFTLLSDPEKELAEAFGVWVKKKNYGREYMGIERSTFLVDAEGKIVRAWRGVKVDGHVDRVLEEAQRLT